MEQQFGFKDLYDLKIKTTYPLEIGNIRYEENETIAFFDKIQISSFDEIKKVVTAHGGYQDRPRVFWETTKEIDFSFRQGIFSEFQFGAMTNAKFFLPKKVLVSKRENGETDETGKFTLSEEPVGKIFVYDAKTFEKIGSIAANGKTYTTGKPFQEIYVDYEYEYTDVKTLEIGKQMMTGFLSIEAKTRVQDDITGKFRTAIIKIPKFKMLSNLSMSLGENAVPVAGRFAGVGCPTGPRANTYVMEIDFLNDDIDEQ